MGTTTKSVSAFHAVCEYMQRVIKDETATTARRDAFAFALGRVLTIGPEKLPKKTGTTTGQTKFPKKERKPAPVGKKQQARLDASEAAGEGTKWAGLLGKPSIKPPMNNKHDEDE